MKIISLRFEGEIPAGKFEYNCICGNYSGPEKLKQGSQVLVCKYCGVTYNFVQQESHFHLHVRVLESGGEI